MNAGDLVRVCPNGGSVIARREPGLEWHANIMGWMDVPTLCLYLASDDESHLLLWQGRTAWFLSAALVMEVVS